MKNFFFLGNFPLYFIYLFILLEANYFAILNWFCHTSTWICHGCTSVPRPEPPSHLLPHPFPLGHPFPLVPVHQPLAPFIMLCTWTGESFHIWCYTCFNAILPNHLTLTLSHRVQKTVLYICLFCCLAYRVIISIFLNSVYMHSVQFSSVSQSCPTLCDPLNCSMPGLPIHHQLPEFTQTHVHRVSDVIQPSHPLSSPSPPAPNPSQH